MELALYDPADGYYAGTARGLGREGDFFTASDSGRAFGRCLARQLIDIDGAIGPLAPFEVLEFGSGRGLLARDILDALAALAPDLARRVRYTMADRSAGMRQTAGAAVPESEICAPEDVEGARRGCVLASELFDALPVHRLRRRGGRLLEVFVGVDSAGALVELEGDPTPRAAALAERYGAAAEDGLEGEVCPAALAQFDRMAATLDRGVMILVDYGGRADEVYGPWRSRGTLLAYHRHATNEDYLARVGEQDLTAHVNFSALEDRARELGFDVLGLTTQDRFLIACGILDVFEGADDAAWSEPRRVKERLQARQLIQPTGMGRVFKVLLLSRGTVPPPRLIGMTDPFARDRA